MENLDLTLTAICPAQGMPDGGQYVHFMDSEQIIRYGFWSERIEKFYWMGGSTDKAQVQCWYEVPRRFPVVAKG